MRRRGSGILLHISSLPSPFGIGDLGPQAYQFADFLSRAGQNYWQVLPLTPTHPSGLHSPYHSRSAFAGNPLFISPELLVQDGLLLEGEFSPPHFPDPGVDFPKVISYKDALFDLAFDHFQARGPGHDYEEFCSRHSDWLEDYARFVAYHSHLGEIVWGDWPPEIRDRHPEALRSLDQEVHYREEREKFLQYTFFRQWQNLKKYCNQRGIYLIGDLPIYVQYDSADLWMHPDLFKLDGAQKPSVVAGVPPDYFSETGQRWGNPIYRWDVLRQRGFDWWVQRMEHNREFYDLLRVDHFLGLIAYWEIPAQDPTAVNGKWVEAPGEDLLKVLFKKNPFFPLIAEDLGMVTPAVREVIRRFEIPGMKVLLFAFGDNLATNPYLPHNHIPNCIVYTGTHDNNTVRGWFVEETSPEERQRLFRYLGREFGPEDVSQELVRMAMKSVADTVIIPIQDLLGMGAENRMNTPSSVEGNWRWRLLPEHLTPGLAEWLRELTETYGRD